MQRPNPVGYARVEYGGVKKWKFCAWNSFYSCPELYQVVLLAERTREALIQIVAPKSLATDVRASDLAGRRWREPCVSVKQHTTAEGARMFAGQQSAQSSLLRVRQCGISSDDVSKTTMRRDK